MPPTAPSEQSSIVPDPQLLARQARLRRIVAAVMAGATLLLLVAGLRAATRSPDLGAPPPVLKVEALTAKVPTVLSEPVAPAAVQASMPTRYSDAKPVEKPRTVLATQTKLPLKPRIQVRDPHAARPLSELLAGR